jgi:hypothetical protein
MDLILNAIEAIESREDHASFSYRKVANQFGVDRTTVLRHYQGIRGSNEEMGKAQQLLSPQQELELVRKTHNARLATYTRDCAKFGQRSCKIGGFAELGNLISALPCRQAHYQMEHRNQLRPTQS